MDVEGQLNWLLNHWYYFAILGMAVLSFELYHRWKKEKDKYFDYVKERAERKEKDDKLVNPPTDYHILRKRISILNPTYKILGKIKSFSRLKVGEIKEKNKELGLDTVEDIDEIEITADTRILNLGKLCVGIGNTKIFRFEPDGVVEFDPPFITIPYNYYFTYSPTGSYILMNQERSAKNYVNDFEKVNAELKELAINGFASQMASFSAVKPTWGQQRDEIERKGKARFGFLDDFKDSDKKDGKK